MLTALLRRRSRRMRLGVFVLSLAALAAGLAVLGAHGAQAPRYDVILRGGTIIDGTGAPRYAGDVAITGGTIARVGDLAGAEADVDLDVAGLYVTPGFINLHSHPTPAGLERAVNMLTQGVTTGILNPDGGGALDIAAQLERLAASGLAVNIGANIGFNTIWREVVGPDDRRPADADRERMRALILAGLEAGAWGVSAGLDYKPAYFATTEEVIGVVEAARPWRTIFTNHDRLTPELHYSSRAGVTETLGIGGRAGLVPVVTHMKAQGHEQGTGQALIDLIERSAGPGRLAAADAYPYLAGQSGLGALIIPGWAQEGGRDRMLERFKDPGLRAKIVAESEEAMDARFGGPQGVFVTGLDKELTDLMREMGGVPPGEAVVRTLEQANRGAILRFGTEADLVAILQGPTTSMACDCGATEGPASHPRFYGSFPRVLGRYVREQGHLTWEDAIRKMTGLPANTIGMVDRGFLAPGQAADVTVFDPTTIIDRATFESPIIPSVGVLHVLVNGRFALRDGAATGVQAGQALRRTPHMPSRPMSADVARSLTARGTVRAADTGVVTLDVDVRQAEGAHQAGGHLRITDARGATIDVVPGTVQAANGWASVTGVATIDGILHGVIVIVDTADPLSANGEPIVSIDAGDGLRLTGPLTGGPPIIEPE